MNLCVRNSNAKSGDAITIDYLAIGGIYSVVYCRKSTNLIGGSGFLLFTDKIARQDHWHVTFKKG